MKQIIEVTEPTPCFLPENRYAFEQIISITVAKGGAAYKGDTARQRNLVNHAKGICKGCPERQQCLEVHGRDYTLGVVAGATDDERQRLFGEAAS